MGEKKKEKKEKNTRKISKLMKKSQNRREGGKKVWVAFKILYYIIPLTTTFPVTTPTELQFYNVRLSRNKRGTSKHNSCINSFFITADLQNKT